MIVKLVLTTNVCILYSFIAFYLITSSRVKASLELYWNQHAHIEKLQFLISRNNDKWIQLRFLKTFSYLSPTSEWFLATEMTTLFYSQFESFNVRPLFAFQKSHTFHLLSTYLFNHTCVFDFTYTCLVKLYEYISTFIHQVNIEYLITTKHSNHV